MNKTYYESEGLKTEVLIVEEKVKFGRKMVRIMPVSGSGEKWVNKESIIYSVPNLKKKIVSNNLVENIKN